MASIEWKGIVWKGAYGVLSVKELLATLKGHGPLEVLDFEAPGSFSGRLSLGLSNIDAVREITLFNLEITGERRRGSGRKAVLRLREIFGGRIYGEDSGDLRTVDGEELAVAGAFWAAMRREGLLNDSAGDSQPPVSARAHAVDEARPAS